jgi:hypothetical protein
MAGSQSSDKANPSSYSSGSSGRDRPTVGASPPKRKRKTSGGKKPAKGRGATKGPKGPAGSGSSKGGSNEGSKPEAPQKNSSAPKWTSSKSG